MNKVGVIGLGNFGSFAIQAFRYLKDFELTAVSEIRKEVPIPDAVKFYANYHDLLNDPEIDVVHIVTENFSHTKIAKEALQKGKKVLAEKPLFISSGEQSEITAEFQKNPFLKINFVLPQSNLYKKVFHTIKTGRLGKLLLIRAENYSTESRKGRAWYRNEKKTGGWFATSDIHFLHLCEFATGEMPRPVSITKFKKKSVISTAGYFCCKDVLLVLYHHMDADGFEKCSAKFVFEKGEMTVCGWVPMKLVEKNRRDINIIQETETEEEVYLKLIAKNYKTLFESTLKEEFLRGAAINELALKINDFKNGKNKN